jgi:hypothetical protein
VRGHLGAFHEQAQAAAAAGPERLPARRACAGATQVAALAQAESPIFLYKALLAGHVADHLKAGKLNLAHSRRYRPSDTYLLDAAT